MTTILHSPHFMVIRPTATGREIHEFDSDETARTFIRERIPTTVTCRLIPFWSYEYVKGGVVEADR